MSLRKERDILAINKPPLYAPSTNNFWNDEDHVPACLQPFINEKLKALVKIGELIAVEKEKTPIEYRLYVKERDKQLKESS